MTILVLDDEVDAQFFLEQSLNRVLPDCRVLMFSSSAAALEELARGTRIDAIVTDHQLRRTSGCDFTREVRQYGFTGPVVMVTGSRDPKVVREAYDLGVTKVFEAGGDEFAQYLKQAMPDTGAAPC